MAKCCNLPIGERRTLVTIQAQVVGDDGLFGETVEWSNVGDPVWARMKFKSGNERFDRDALRGEAGYTFEMDYNDASFVTVKHRFVVDSIPYNIRSVDNVDQRNIVLMCVGDTGVAQ